MNTRILETRKLSGGYADVPIVQDVDVYVEKGEIVALVGPNGAGKSTLLKTIYGIAKVFGGKVVFDSKDVTALPPEKKTMLGMGFVPQTDNVFPDLTVEENLEMGAYLVRDENKIRDAMETIFNIFPALRELRHVLAGSLSGGQQRMVAVGRALMTRPKILLLDEPTAGLAPKIAIELLNTLKTIREEANVSILIVEQHARRALELSDRGYVLVYGKIAAEGLGKEILSRPDLQKLFLGGRRSEVD
ncbi:ABC transporter ATP-binding protein [Pyrofollis japonicus]|uniref:ABC transporter ATP-binding protein n=1 Tax=Pyrofollis japonicus TaxID=3060460 RepID=UPI00295AD5DD|nr:ABC transporter ATP-binding protein [Pyrofollis japonicus]BEP18287.1 ABC transporter ATP-binding protein [Pyrofollis japonicus]